MFRHKWISAAVLLAALALAACGRQPPVTLRGVTYEPPAPAPDFTLNDQHGQPFRLSEQQGKVVLLFFGFTHCPDVCPTTLGLWNRVHRDLGDEAEKVRFVFVTVDPARDTPERLAEHLALFGPDIVGLTGDAAALEPVYQAYDIVHEKVALDGGDYTVNHNSSIYVVDRQGRLRMRHLFGSTPDDLLHDVRQLLK